MSIQMRKGYYDDFDPTKMTPGEWAVSIDEDSNKQIVWMCFAPGVVKRMGTVEDFDVEIQRLIHNQMESINTSVSNANQSEVNAKISEDNAKMYAESASTSALNAKISETNAKTSEEECKKVLESVPKDITTITNQVNQNTVNIESLQSNKADKATTLAGYGITDAQEKLTNPLTQSDVVDNLSSTAINKPLSANQGRVLSSNVNAQFYNAVSHLWNDTTTYEVGQYCIFSFRLWKCLIRNSGQIPQEGTYWTQTSIDEEITELNSNLANTKRTLLWTNPKPTDSFANSTISVPNLSDYDELEVHFKNSTTSSGCTVFKITKYSYSSRAYAFSLGTSFSDCALWIRSFWADFNNNSITFDSANKLYTSNTVDNMLLIPYKVYGYKNV